jgi:hypothetical protein
MSLTQRAVLAVCSVLTVAGVAVAGATPSATAGVAGARAPLAGQLLGVSCTATTACMAVGSAGGPNFTAGLLADRWNGATWSVVPVPAPHGAQDGDLAGVACTSPSACMAVGAYQTKRIFAPLVERWDGTAWAVIPTPRVAGMSPALGSVSCAATNSCAAVGCFINGNVGCVGSFAEEWNGTAWQIEPTPAGGLRLSSVSCTAPSACTAVGNGSKGTLAERWNGRAWSVVPTPNPPRNRGFLELDGVSCLAAGCEAVGSYANNGGAIVTLAERWNGHAWSIQKSPNAPGALVALGGVSCTSASACTAVGNYDNNTGQTLGTALRWNGTAWTLQSPANPRTKPFVVVTLSAVSCPAAVSCTTVGYNVFGSEGATRALAEGWNGTSWALEPTPAPAR